MYDVYDIITCEMGLVLQLQSSVLILAIVVNKYITSQKTKQNTNLILTMFR